jgi:hypothetical protein
VIGSHEESAILFLVGVAGLVTWFAGWRQGWLPIIAGIVTGLGAAMLAANLRKGCAWRQQELAIRRLWRMARRMPPGTTFIDPETGQGITAGRYRGSVVLVVTETAVDEQTAREAIQTVYLLGRGAAPNPPPLLRRVGPAGEPVTVCTPFSQRLGMLAFNDIAGGALQTGLDEILVVQAAADRATERGRSIPSAQG